MHRRPAKGSSTTGDQRICTKENCLTCCKKFTAFMFSRVGLFFVMIGYVALGGGLFQALEAGNEQMMRQSMSEELNSTLYKLWNVILRVNSFPYHDKKGNFTLNATQELEKFEATVRQQVRKGFDGRTGPDAATDWNYFGAILYAVTLVSTIGTLKGENIDLRLADSLGYGHITTKTVYGKIATILYSAFGVPLMMLFVANIGSTMAKMFTFVFSRLTTIFCCRWRNKKRRKSFRIRVSTNQIAITLDEKPTLKSNIKLPTLETRPTVDDQLLKFSSPINIDSPPTPSTSETRTPPLDPKLLPADVRLNLLTGVPTEMTKSHSVTSSTNSVSNRPKDALSRINDLIKQSSVHDNDDQAADKAIHDNKRLSLPSTDQQVVNEANSIQFYINETEKLTNKLENSIHSSTLNKTEPEKINITNLDDIDVQQIPTPDVSLPPPETTNLNGSAIAAENETQKSAAKKKLKRSKSELTHNRKIRVQSPNTSETAVTDDREPVKSSRRRFFLRRLKKQSALDDEIHKTGSLEQISIGLSNKSINNLPRKSQSFNEGLRSLSPPPEYEESATRDITPSTTVTWKPDHELHSTKLPFEYPTHQQLDEEEEEFYEDEQMSVPLLVTVFVIPLYLTLGAILFNIWEKWGFLNSFYFCFITLTTIGFGDFVPGSSLTVSAAKEKLISAALYILLGLVLIAMCFNLMKEQLSQKVKQVAGKWGISEF
ncbi:unnamed protein product [Adineta ricciae]|uniref:Potassium channel domain-containing protein n=1 Tax=Adineta ricciae TaxID=249248 RepID=A0A813R0S1_ADIRI|nr:unnamed protein product [Adineta ricciae]